MQRKVPLPGKIFTWCILQQRFAGLFGCMARISCQSQLILNTRRRYIATKGPFSRPRPFWDTPGQNIAIVRHPGTHNVNISPPPDAWECISRTPCRRRTAESALRAHVAMRRPPGNALRGHVLPCPTARWRTAAAYRQQSHPSAAQGAVCSFPPYPARAYPRDAAVPSCGGGRRRDERAGTLARAAYWGGAGGTLMRAAYLEHGRGIGARRPLGVAAH